MGAHQIRQSVASREKPEFTSYFFFFTRERIVT